MKVPLQRPQLQRESKSQQNKVVAEPTDTRSLPDTPVSVVHPNSGKVNSGDINHRRKLTKTQANMEKMHVYSPAAGHARTQCESANPEVHLSLTGSEQTLNCITKELVGVTRPAAVDVVRKRGRPHKKAKMLHTVLQTEESSSHLSTAESKDWRKRKRCIDARGRLQSVTTQADPDTMSKQADEGNGDVGKEMDCGELAWEYEGNTNDSFSNGSKSTDEGFKDLPESHQNPIITDVNILETMSHESFSKSDVVQGEEFTSKKIKKERDGVGDETEYNPTSSCPKARGRPKGRPKGTGKTCEYCGRHFDFVSVYTVHLRTHTGERPYKCIDCDQDFAQLSNLKSHIKKHNRRCQPLKCPYCKMKFSNSNELLAHCKWHSGKGGILKCHICGKVFPFWSGLQVHIRMHTGEKPYICKVCGKAFSNRSSIRIHEVTHWSIKPYNCTWCGKSFTQLSSAKKHPCKGLRESNDRESRKKGEKMTSKSEFRIWKPRLITFGCYLNYLHYDQF
uniref:C2H2-type domain-containing protein n=1 Tax=Salmo trutta TaxID=8032 RepID=A0A674DG32_SALTR